MNPPIKFRSDIDRLLGASRETRTRERLLAHFTLERQLAGRLRSSTPDERGRLYSQVYDELFASLPDHPQHRASSTTRQIRLEQQKSFLLARLTAQSVYVEIGCGDAALTKLIAPYVRRAVGVDVTGALVGDRSEPAGFSFLQTDGTTVSLPDDTVDVVYSNQLMEHLHPDDAIAQLAEILRILKPAGQYICTTPNRLTGPHDISRYFGREPYGFHLREYDHRDLNQVFRQVGFREVRPIVFVKGQPLTIPMALVSAVEATLRRLPAGVRAAMAASRIVTNMAGVTVVGVK